MGNFAGTFRLGCQTFTWEMLGEKWRGSPDDILDTVAAAGYAGVEFSNQMIGNYAGRPAEFEKALKQRGLACAAYAYAETGFSDPQREEADLEGAEQALRFAAHFSAVVCLAGPASESRENYEAKFAQVCRFYQQVGQMAAKLGVTASVHPHSHHTSLVLTPPEYDRLLEATKAAGIMFNPDTGHMLRGGHDVMATLDKYRDRVVHIHLKDVDAEGRWQSMGNGVVDIPALLWIEKVGYPGWIVAEEESEAVWQNAAKAIAEDRTYLRTLGC